MFQAVGNQVLELKRLKIGGLCLDPSLEPGQCRLLEAAETAAIFQQDMAGSAENSPSPGDV